MVEKSPDINEAEKHLAAYRLAEKIRLYGEEFVSIKGRQRLIKEGIFDEDEANVVLSAGLVRWAQNGLEREFLDDTDWNVVVYETAASVLEKKVEPLLDLKPATTPVPTSAPDIKKVLPTVAPIIKTVLASVPIISSVVVETPIVIPAGKKKRPFLSSIKDFAKKGVNTKLGRAVAGVFAAGFLAFTTATAKGIDVVSPLADHFSGTPDRPTATLNITEAAPEPVVEDLPFVTFSRPDSYYTVVKGRSDLSSLKGKAEGFLAEYVFGIENFNPYIPDHMRIFEENFKKNPALNKFKVSALAEHIKRQTEMRTVGEDGKPKSPFDGDTLRHFKTAGMVHGLDDQSENNLVKYFVPRDISEFFQEAEQDYMKSHTN